MAIETKEAFTHDEIEAALCMWEAMLAMRERNERLNTQFENHGAWAMRTTAIDLAEHCEQVWQAITNNGEDDTITFDWEFCPAYIAVWVAADCMPLPVADCVAKINAELNR